MELNAPARSHLNEAINDAIWDSLDAYPGITVEDVEAGLKRAAADAPGIIADAADRRADHAANIKAAADEARAYRSARI